VSRQGVKPMETKHKAISIRTEPKGEVFSHLLDFVMQQCKYFSLHWLEGGPRKIERAATVDAKLRLFLIENDERRQWSGLYHHTSLYQVSLETMAILKKAPSLYLWNEVGWPDDLMLYTEKDVLWLFSSSHNREAHIFTKPISLDLVITSNPGLDLATEKPVITIDGENFNSLEEFAEETSLKLFPELNFQWKGNLDSFNDLLWGGYGTPEYGFVLVWRNSDRSREMLGYPETLRQLREKKETCHSSAIPLVEEEIKRAEAGEGPTVFDWLIEILNDHDLIDVVLV
jgi:hypothetical protein